MAKKKAKTIRKDQTTDDEEEGGDTGGSGGSGFVPSYSDLIAVDSDEAEIAKNAKEALFAQRVSLKSQGNKVSALDKLQKMRNQLSDPTLAAQLAAGGGSGLEEHPELPELGGAFDDIVFPESEAEAAARASNDPKLRNRLAARLGMGRDLSALTQKMEYEKKQKLKMQARPAPEEEYRPRFRPAAPPKPRPGP